MQEIIPVLKSWADQNEKEIDICDQYLDKMLRKVYPGREVECNNSSQHKIDYKRKGVNDDNGETQEEENIIQEKQKMKHRNVTLTFMSITKGIMRSMNKTRMILKLKKRKMQNHKITKKTIQTKEGKKLKTMKRS